MGALNDHLRLLKRALEAGDISEEDYHFEVSLAKKYARSGDLAAPSPKTAAKRSSPGLSEVEIDYDFIIHESEKAWLLQTPDFGKQWFPMSQCELKGDTVVVPHWLYNKLLEKRDEI